MFQDDEEVDLSGNERADDIHLQLLEGGHTLKLGEAYFSDSGIYTCYTDNGKSSQFIVKVLVRPHFVQEFPQTDYELKQGDQLTLDCSAAGSPTPKVFIIRTAFFKKFDINALFTDILIIFTTWY